VAKVLLLAALRRLGRQGLDDLVVELLEKSVTGGIQNAAGAGQKHSAPDAQRPRVRVLCVDDHSNVPARQQSNHASDADRRPGRIHGHQRDIHTGGKRIAGDYLGRNEYTRFHRRNRLDNKPRAIRIWIAHDHHRRFRCYEIPGLVADHWKPLEWNRMNANVGRGFVIGWPD
jgi:hypothetical protein